MLKIKKHKLKNLACRRLAFTMTEIIVVIVIVALSAVVVQLNAFNIFRKNTFKAQAQEFVDAVQTAANAAAQSDRRYEIIIDITEQKYTLREITSTDLTEVLDEEIILEKYFSSNCAFEYVIFDDLIATDAEHQIAKFRAGHAGWQNGGKIVLLDENDNPYSVIVNRLNRIIYLQRGDFEILLPKTKSELPF
jgi:type II secretory pathway pseudopilin PulG